MWPALSRFLSAHPHWFAPWLRHLLEADGGFTVDLLTGMPVSSGISVATRPGAALSFTRGTWDDHAVDAWTVALRSGPRWRCTRIGGWVDPDTGTVWLDVVRVVPAACMPVAVLLGRVTAQRCVFDLDRGRAVAL